MADSKDKQGRKETVRIVAQYPKSVSEEEARAIIQETENEVIDSFSGDRGTTFLKFKGKEKAEVVIEVPTEKEKTIF
jgi:hypothetical protein